MTPIRLDLALVGAGLARSRSHARQLIDAGRVEVPGLDRVKPATLVDPACDLSVRVDPYVSRAAHKLVAALDQARIDIRGRALDAGASTGGFTQVLLERGAEQVYAIDVGHGQIAETIRRDPRVVTTEGLNLRDLSLADVGSAPVDLAVADVSFISLRLVLEPILSVVDHHGFALVLVKPQFEVGRAQLDSHGVVTSDRARQAAVAQVVDHATGLGWALQWSADSVLPGQDGNREVFCLFRRHSADQ